MNRVFYILVVDQDKLVANLLGPVEDDTPWIDEVCRLQESGRHVNCQTICVDEVPDPQKVAKDYCRVQNNLLIETPICSLEEPVKSEYINVPKYAKNESPDKLVKIFCKGSCRCVRFAKLNKKHPGWDILKSANFDEYVAECLRCGYIARDNYNWIKSG